MMPLYLSLTDAGLAAVQGASGADPVTIAELGLTATPFTVAPSLTALPGEFKRIAAISGTAAAANVTHMTAYDTSADVWNATGMGLWLADGTLFAVYSSGSTIINKAAPAFALIAFDIAFSADLASNIAFGDPLFTNPPATESVRGLVELATLAEAQAGTDEQRALTPARAKASVVSWLGFTPLDQALYTAASVLARLITVDGAGSGLDADLLDGQHRSQIAPAGMIVMWSGSIASIPAGWTLCDGANGTPDLRNRFIVGAGDDYAPGNTGGAESHNHAITVAGHVLTEAQIPSHDHEIVDPGHAHQQRRDDNFGAQNSASGNPDGTHGVLEYGLTSTATTGITISPAGGGEAHSHGASSADASSLPPYFALAFIMKL